MVKLEEADEGYHDDLVMCMVLFAWLVMQEYFREMTDQDVRRRIYDEQRNQIEQDMAPFGFVDDGMGDDTFIDGDGTVWQYGDTQEEVCTGTNKMFDDEAEDYSTMQEVLKSFPDIKMITIDVANAYHQNMVGFVQKVTEEYPDKVIVAGNVVTPEMTEENYEI